MEKPGRQPFGWEQHLSSQNDGVGLDQSVDASFDFLDPFLPPLGLPWGCSPIAYSTNVDLALAGSLDTIPLLPDWSPVPAPSLARRACSTSSALLSPFSLATHTRTREIESRYLILVKGKNATS